MMLLNILRQVIWIDFVYEVNLKNDYEKILKNAKP